MVSWQRLGRFLRQTRPRMAAFQERHPQSHRNNNARRERSAASHQDPRAGGRRRRRRPSAHGLQAEPEEKETQACADGRRRRGCRGCGRRCRRRCGGLCIVCSAGKESLRRG
eukprot:Amastigsp_a180289_46.p4 type:complete len:112 gc:universal Amastigsp_a180289_46:501-166(-)